MDRAPRDQPISASIGLMYTANVERRPEVASRHSVTATSTIQAG